VKPRVLFLSGREVAYMRNRVLIAALKMHFDVTVIEGRVPTTAGRSLAGLARLLSTRPDYQACLVGFYAQPLAIALSRVQRQPLIVDAYVSTFDTLTADRGWLRPGSPLGRLAHWLDRQSCQVATCVLTDTAAHADYFSQTFGTPRDKLAPVYVGCDQDVFYPRQATTAHPDRCAVFYYGSFLRLHGTDVIVEAAQRLRHRRDIHFTLGGDGPQWRGIAKRIAGLELDNVDLVGWIPLAALPDHIAGASICLGGHFSTVPKAARVISTKTYQFLAMARPTIVGDNAATRELLAHGEHAWMVPMGDPGALAAGIERLVDDAVLRRHLAQEGRTLFRRRLSTAAISDQLAGIVGEALDTCTSVS
jgi:glycosyltransferase involved in cell wall biosynthesis